MLSFWFSFVFLITGGGVGNAVEVAVPRTLQMDI